MPETPDLFSAEIYLPLVGVMVAGEVGDHGVMRADITPEIWSFRPVKDMSETLQFSTDVMRTFASEMRVSRRPARQGLAFSYTLRDPRLARMETRVRRNVLGDWMVPVWHEATLIASTVPGQTVIEVDTRADYRVAGFALFWSRCDKVQIRRIEEIGDGEIEISHPLDALSGSAFVAPGRVGFLLDGIGGARIRERGISGLDVEFQIRDSVDLAATDFDQYVDRDLVSKCGTLEALSLSISPDVAIVDSDLGVIDRELSRDLTDGRFAMLWRMDRAKLWRVRQWLHYLRGRDRSFWLIDWQKDFTLAAPIGAADTSILVEAIAFSPAELVGVHVMIDDGTRSPRLVTAAVAEGALHRLTIAPLGRSIAAAKVSRMRLVRLDSDLIEITHRMGFYSSLRLPLIEVIA